MFYNAFKVLISVRAKLFLGFFAMAILVTLLGGYSYMSIGSAKHVVEETYDRPLMAINYARSASQILANIKLEAHDHKQINERGGEPDKSRFEELRKAFQADLGVARSRSIAPRAKEYFDKVDRLRYEWQEVTNSDVILEGDTLKKTEDLYNQIAKNLDIIIDLQTNESFRAREAAVTRMEKIEKFSVGAMFLALILTVMFSAWIALTIINPLKAAADAARKISAGNLDAEIPKGGVDETGALLKTMAVMQTSLRQRMATEQNSRALAQSRLAESLENSKDAVMLADANGRIIVANGALKSMFPVLAGKDLIHKPYSDYFELSGLPISGGCIMHPDVNELQFADGRWARVNGSNTQEGGLLIIWMDITESKEREMGLREAKEKAEAANKSKTLFLATMSHELRTPLNAVIGFANLISSEGLGKINNEKYTEMAELISQSGSHLLHVVKDVLTIADGRNPHDTQSDMEPLDLFDVIEFCMVTIQKTAKAKGIRIITEERGEPIMIMGDRVRLQQMGLNILSNAIKFNKPGGFVKAVIGARSDKAVRIDVIDSGIGIAPEDLDRITEPFVQVSNGHTTQYEGVGLGLSIVEKWVSHHNGKMSIRSWPGKGTIVSLAFPLIQSKDRPLNVQDKKAV